jgi:hypothetical protein
VLHVPPRYARRRAAAPDILGSTAIMPRSKTRSFVRIPEVARVAVVLLLAAGVVTLNSCGDEDGVGAQACGEYGEVLGAMCDVMDRCPGTLYPLGYRNRAECMDTLCFATTCSLDFAEVDGIAVLEIQQRVPLIDPTQKNACIRWLEQASCDDIRRSQDNPCDHLVIDPDPDAPGGQVGEPCSTDAECRADLHCAEGGIDEEEALRTCPVCAPLPTRGEPCVAGWRCAEGFHCDSVDGEQQCIPSFIDGEACSTHAQCVSQYCDPATGICMPVGHVGDPCATHGDCLAGTFCGGESTCEPVREIGEPCIEAAQCRREECDLQANLCGRGDGQPCDPFLQECHGTCDPDTSTCIAGLAVGQPCELDHECASRRCDPGLRVCRAACWDSDDCGGDEYCELFSRTCVPLREDGSGCVTDEECVSGTCSFAGRCGPMPAIGDPCSSSIECHPIGFCDAGTCQAFSKPGERCEALEACQQPFICIDGQCRRMNLACRPGQPGERCTFLQVCDATSYCDPSNFTCVRRGHAGERCASDEMCMAPLHCHFDAEISACVMPAAAGEPCGESRRCADGLSCDDEICRQLRGYGEPCTSTSECSAGLSCEGDDRGTFCIDNPEGRPCDFGDDVCPEWFHCEWDTRTCQRNPGLGGDCFLDEECARGFYCDGIVGCQPWRGLGEACAAGVPCEEDLYCDDLELVCVPRLGLGDPCPQFGDQCATGLVCRDGSGSGDFTCHSLLDPGQPCSDHQHCRSGVCDEEFGCLAAAECKVPEPDAAN